VNTADEVRDLVASPRPRVVSRDPLPRALAEQLRRTGFDAVTSELVRPGQVFTVRTGLPWRSNGWRVVARIRRLIRIFFLGWS
jgi:hypothetical protein